MVLIEIQDNPVKLALGIPSVKPGDVAKLVQDFVVEVMSAAYFFPLYWMLISALKEPQEVAQWPPTFFPQTFTFNAFAEVLKTFPVFRWFVNSAFVSSSIVLIVLLATSLAAFAFAYYDFPAKNFLFMYILSTLMIPIHVRMIPSYLLIKMFRWIETYRGLIIPQAAALCGIGVLLLRQFYVGIPRDLVDAARRVRHTQIRRTVSQHQG
jgi:ABC-type glycerol-3-phosphate transport system permease component